MCNNGTWDRTLTEDVIIRSSTNNAIIVPNGKTMTFVNDNLDKLNRETSPNTHYVSIHCQKGGKVVIKPGNIVEHIVMFGGDLILEEAGKITTLVVYGGYVRCAGVLHRCWMVEPGKFSEFPTCEAKDVYDEHAEMVLDRGAYASCLCNQIARCSFLPHSHVNYYEQTGTTAQTHMADNANIDDGAFYEGKLFLHNGAATPRIFRSVEVTESNLVLTGTKGELYNG